MTVSVVSKRWQIHEGLRESPETDLCDSYFSLDKLGSEEQLWQLFVVRRSKLPDLMESILWRRAETIKDISVPGTSNLVDYGFDGGANLYYFVYALPEGIRLDRYLARYSLSFTQTIQILENLIKLLHDLLGKEIAWGQLSVKQIYINAATGEISSGNLVGLAELVRFIDGSESSFGTVAEEDLRNLANVTSNLLSPQMEENELSPGKFESGTQEVIDRLLKLSPHNLAEYATILQQVRAALEKEEKYYLRLTKSATESLAEYGFIPQPYSSLAISFLQHQLLLGGSGWIEQTKDGVIYRLETPQLTLVCRPNEDMRATSLVIVDIWISSLTDHTSNLERGLRLNKTFIVVEKLSEIPGSADIQPLLDELNIHVQIVSREKSEQIGSKSQLATWAAVLEEQKRQLHKFRLMYVDLKIVDNDSAIQLTLAEPEDPANFPTEELFRLTGDRGQQVIAGNFEDLTGVYLKLGIARGVNPEDFKLQGLVTVDNAQADAVITRQQKALDKLRYFETVNPRLPQLLREPARIEIDPPYPLTFTFEPRLDENQRIAVRKALATKDIFLIQGPPGTGKTSVIAELVLQIIDTNPHARILVTSQSNVAVNNALDVITTLNPAISNYVVRIGREEKAGSAEALLLEHQLSAWRQGVLAQSETYMEKLRSEIGSRELGDALAMLEECEELTEKKAIAQNELEKLNERIVVLDEKYDEFDTQLQALRDMQSKTTALLSQVPTDDERLQTALNIFGNQTLKSVQELLMQAEAAVGLSTERVTTIDSIASIKTAIKNLENDIAAATDLVNSILYREYNIHFEDWRSQQEYIQSIVDTESAELTKLGKIEKIIEDWAHRINLSDEALSSAFVHRCHVVGATCIGVAARGAISELEFDWVIADEAGKAFAPELLVPLVRGRRLILVGDHKQLPPTMTQDIDQATKAIDVGKETISTSLFEELIRNTSNDAKLQLNMQYRMHPAIGKLVSDCFYEGKVKTNLRASDREHGIDWIPRSVVWYNTNNLTNAKETGIRSFYNQAEIDVIVNLLMKFQQTYAKQDKWDVKIGIITGYALQKQQLKQTVERHIESLPNISRYLEVDTVDAYQGRQRDIVIYSVVRNNTERKIGFLRDERRLNVALSRARNLLVIVGSISIETATADNNPFFDVISHIKSHKDECLIIEAER